MPRKSLRPQLNQIRAWVRQGRTDAWVAHQLEVTVQEIEQFKRQNELVGDEEAATGLAAADFPEEIDLRAEDDALIAAELEAAALEAERERAEAEAAERARAEQAERERAERAARGEPRRRSEGGEAEDEEGRQPRRRSRRGGRGRRSPASAAPPPWKAPSTTARRATACGWTPPSRTTRSTPSTGPATAPSRSLVEEDQIVIRRVGGDD